ncbi:transmembrane protein 65 [Hyalella azteca]|uniref:Transmembrane protein 65 n=1 Tax=Hyalella azteca TaxID=294128 RepID=A0A8B7PCA3_HYAAZ|nr:transmembrane protein 65 [Hyalella azteca]
MKNLRKFVHLLCFKSGHNVRGLEIKSYNLRTYCQISKESKTSGTSATESLVENLAVPDFVSSLSAEKRQEILLELHKLEAAEARKKAEDKLASWRWRSRFGRPSSVHKLGADPTGTYCAIPEGWLKEKAAVAAKPTAKQLQQLALFNALPFVGFGFLDNLIMIIAGDYIDATIGTLLGISTMAAAALGNTISDLAGIGSAWYVEWAAEKIGVTAPPLTPTQMETPGARYSANAGRAIGVVFGCILGMFPLLFITCGKNQESKKEENAKPPDVVDVKKA